MWVQYPDLTEDYSSDWGTNIKQLKTQFAFCTTSPTTTPYVKRQLIKLGFECMSSMNNWHSGHCDNRRQIDLWWYKSPTLQKEKQILSPLSWIGTFGRRLQATGCGFALTHTLHHRYYWRFHTLMRMPVNPSKFQLRWLKRCHYFKLDEGVFSSYWANGFPPKEYSWELEKKYWNSVKISIDANRLVAPLKNQRILKPSKKEVQERMKQANQNVAAYNNINYLAQAIPCNRILIEGQK